MSFQIGDDLQDQLQDGTNCCEINIASTLGIEKSYELFHEEMEQFVEGLKRLGLWNEEFEKTADYLYNLVPAAVKLN